MTNPQSLPAQQKRELATKEEKTAPSKFYVPPTDIYESDEALIVAMEVPGVEKGNVDVRLEDDVLNVEARIDFGKYDGMAPLYTEYGVGHFARSFSLSNRIDRDRIEAQLTDGVLTLVLPKVKEALPRRISIG